jgi:16S rRNA (guanine966-N2)-methyltransferase
MMRVIAGRFKGRPIVFPRHIRPTQDKVRQAVFDVLAQVIGGARVLDLCAGSGAFGLESLSRGCRGAWFIEKDKRCKHIIDNNLDNFTLSADDRKDVRVFCNDVGRALAILEKKREAFDVIFLDPPYHKGLAKKTLQTLYAGGILTPSGFLVIEHAKTDDLGLTPEGYNSVRCMTYGDIRVTVLQKA